MLAPVLFMSADPDAEPAAEPLTELLELVDGVAEVLVVDDVAPVVSVLGVVVLDP